MRTKWFVAVSGEAQFFLAPNPLSHVLLTHWHRRYQLMQRTREAILLDQSQGEEKAPHFQKGNTSNPTSPLPADIGNSPSLFVKNGYCTDSLDLPISTIRELHVPGTHSAHTECFQSKAIKCYSAFPNRDFSETMGHFHEIAKRSLQCQIYPCQAPVPNTGGTRTPTNFGKWVFHEMILHFHPRAELVFLNFALSASWAKR